MTQLCIIFLYSMSRKGPARNISPGIEDEIYTSKDAYHEDDEIVAIPKPYDFGCSDDSDFDSDFKEKLSSVTYEKAS